MDLHLHFTNFYWMYNCNYLWIFCSI